MKALVAQSMQDGAFGISTALIYPPGHYAKTEELIELAKVVSRYGGLYASHMRSEGQTERRPLSTRHYVLAGKLMCPSRFFI